MNRKAVTPARWSRLGLLGLLMLAGCPSPPPDEEPPPVEPPAEPQLAPLEASEQEIRAADGSVLLHIDDMPTNIRVDEDTEFGAADRFTEASAAPDEQWFAVATAGAAHGAGWLVRAGTRDPRPAAFQYGGSVSIGPWSEAGRYVVFIEDGPAPSRTLSVVDRDELGATVTETGTAVHGPDHQERPLPETAYEPLEWRNAQLVFEVNGERFRFDPATDAVEPDP
jgi:hypothetical protein